MSDGPASAVAAAASHKTRCSRLFRKQLLLILSLSAGRYWVGRNLHLDFSYRETTAALASLQNGRGRRHFRHTDK